MIRLLPFVALLASTTVFAQDNDDPWAQPSDSDTETESDSDSDPDATDGEDKEGETPAPESTPPVADPWAQADIDTVEIEDSVDPDQVPGSTDGAADPPVAEEPDGKKVKTKKVKTKRAKKNKSASEPISETTEEAGAAELGDATEATPVDDVAGTGDAFETAENAAKPVSMAVDPADLPGANVPMGLRIQPYGAGTGVDVGQAFVVGRNGGTNQTNLRARFATGKYGVQLGLPFVVHRMPRQPRDTGLGNLQLDVWRQIGDGSKGYTAIGAEFHTNIGAKSYTWVHDADDVWPGTGLDLALQFRRGDQKLSSMWRFAMGVRGGQDYAPWAATYLTVEAAAGFDYSLGDRLGLTGEMSLAYWDLSPWDATAMMRADLSPGLRLRGGFVFPLGVWTGMSRIDQDFRGLRETTLVMDLSLSL